MPLLLLLGVLAADLAVTLWCWTHADGVDLAGSGAVLLLPQVLYVAVVAAVAREPQRRLPAAGLALLALPMQAVSEVAVEAASGDQWVLVDAPLLRIEALLVGLPLVAAWGVARLEGPWHVGLLAVPATVLAQMLVNDAVAGPIWDAAAQAGPGTGLPVLPGVLWWAWELLPVFVGGLACRWAARPPRVSPLAS